jgi:hypothetical protein
MLLTSFQGKKSNIVQCKHYHITKLTFQLTIKRINIFLSLPVLLKLNIGNVPRFRLGLELELIFKKLRLDPYPVKIDRIR